MSLPEGLYLGLSRPENSIDLSRVSNRELYVLLQARYSETTATDLNLENPIFQFIQAQNGLMDFF